MTRPLWLVLLALMYSAAVHGCVTLHGKGKCDSCFGRGGYSHHPKCWRKSDYCERYNAGYTGVGCYNTDNKHKCDCGTTQVAQWYTIVCYGKTVIGCTVCCVLCMG